MEQSKKRIVSFLFCRHCVNKAKKESDEPCDDCLENPVNVDSRRPIHFEDDGTLPLIFKRRVKNGDNTES